MRIAKIKIFISAFLLLFCRLLCKANVSIGNYKAPVVTDYGGENIFNVIYTLKFLE